MFNKKILIKTLSLHVAKALIAIVLASLAVSFFSWQFEKINTALSEKRKLSYVLEKRSETTAILRKSFTQFDTPEENIKAALLSADDILPFVTVLENTAKNVGLYHTLQFGGLTPYAGDPIRIVRTDFSVAARGNMKTFVRYLEAFETLPYFTGIRSFTISSGAEGWAGEASISASGVLYVKE